MIANKYFVVIHQHIHNCWDDMDTTNHVILGDPAAEPDFRSRRPRRADTRTK